MFYDIEELSKDGDGYVYWRGAHVEHFSYHDDRERDERDAAVRLAEKCRHLESVGVPVNVGTAVWRFSWFADMRPGNPWRDFLADINGDLWEYRPTCKCRPAVKHTCGDPVFGKLAWHQSSRTSAWDRQTGIGPVDTTDYHVLCAAGWRTANAGQPPHCGTVYATLGGLMDLFARHGLTPELLKACQ